MSDLVLVMLAWWFSHLDKVPENGQFSGTNGCGLQRPVERAQLNEDTAA